MNKDAIVAVLGEVFHEVARIDPEVVRPDASLFADLNADSMVIAEALLIIEERFGVQVSDDFSEEMSTVGDLVEHILANCSTSLA